MDRVLRPCRLLLLTVVVMLIVGNVAAKDQIPHLTILTMSLPAATQNAPYSAILVAAGGTPAYNWATMWYFAPSF